EKEVLAPRVAGYRTEWLDELCVAGEAAWGRLSPRRPGSSPNAISSTSRATPVTLAWRRDMGWLLDATRGADTNRQPTSPSAIAVLDQLGLRGALFLDDLTAALGLAPAELAEAIWDLVGRGLVTSDGFQPLRQLITLGRARQRPFAPRGRWCALERPPERSPTDVLADAVLGQLLARYGVVFRELFARESFTVPWRDVLRAARTREARGLLRGGRFVAGFVGEQYALLEAVDALRRTRREERIGEIVRVHPADPLNLVGILTPGARVPSHLRGGDCLVFRDGSLLSTEAVTGVPPVSRVS
ncbi:MAG: DEAD/DEAH box helicase, partial [Myxococcota bacterium]|nr:DEAD/DEAH box helicase [Myxococcota bacterium]